MPRPKNDSSTPTPKHSVRTDVDAVKALPPAELKRETRKTMDAIIALQDEEDRDAVRALLEMGEKSGDTVVFKSSSDPKTAQLLGRLQSLRMAGDQVKPKAPRKTKGR